LVGVAVAFADPPLAITELTMSSATAIAFAALATTAASVVVAVWVKVSVVSSRVVVVVVVVEAALVVTVLFDVSKAHPPPSCLRLTSSGRILPQL
jgi:hypothetical protein